MPVLPKALVLAAMAMASLPLAQPVMASQADVDLLKSYVGDWRGRGTANLAATGKDETMVCRMNVRDSGATRVAFDGRCTLAGRTVAVAGTVAYVLEAGRYEAIMSSVASYQGVAVGQRRGNDIAFDLVDRNPETGDNQVNAALSLGENDILMDFSITNIESGATTTARVPFTR